MLNEPEGTIKSRIRLGLKKLADKLEAAGLGAPS
jgi:DNA-directed RNA polymerase specialized sigma24 family protein